MARQEMTTTLVDGEPRRVIKTVRETNAIPNQSSTQVYAQKKTIFRFYQVFWYVLWVMEILLLFRFILKLLGANTYSSFTSFINGITDPLVAPFINVFGSVGNGVQYVEWASLLAMFVYALIVYAIVSLLQFIKPLSPEEVEENVDSPV